MNVLDQHGTEVFVVELAALGICTVAAIRLDHVRDRREFEQKEKGTSSPRR